MAPLSLLSPFSFFALLSLLSRSGAVRQSACLFRWARVDLCQLSIQAPTRSYLMRRPPQWPITAWHVAVAGWMSSRLSAQAPHRVREEAACRRLLAGSTSSCARARLEHAHPHSHASTPATVVPFAGGHSLCAHLLTAHRATLAAPCESPYPHAGSLPF